MFFGIDWMTSFIKISFQIAFAIVSAVPFMISWNAVIPVYFNNYIPIALHHITYWHFVRILLVFSFLGEQIRKITPIIVNISQNNNK